MGKYIPDSYDAENRHVIQLCTEDPKSVGGPERGAYFVERACVHYIRYADADMLLWAIEHAWPEVSDNAEARAIFAELLRNNTVGKKGVTSKTQKALDDRDQEIFKAVWYYIGMGYPIISSSNRNADKDSACSLAAKRCNTTSRTANNVWKRLGGKTPEGARELIARMAEGYGKLEAKRLADLV